VCAEFYRTWIKYLNCQLNIRGAYLPLLLRIIVDSSPLSHPTSTSGYSAKVASMSCTILCWFFIDLIYSLNIHATLIVSSSSARDGRNIGKPYAFTDFSALWLSFSFFFRITTSGTSIMILRSLRNCVSYPSDTYTSHFFVCLLPHQY